MALGRLSVALSAGLRGQPDFKSSVGWHEGVDDDVGGRLVYSSDGSSSQSFTCHIELASRCFRKCNSQSRTLDAKYPMLMRVRNPQIG